MHVTAHPDDENNSLMAMQSHGLGLRVVLATATRGNGGQNEIGPEMFEALGVLRTKSCARRIASTAPSSSSPRHRLRLLVQRRRDVREVGQGRDPRRLRAPDSHDAAGRDVHDASRLTAGVSIIRPPRSSVSKPFARPAILALSRADRGGAARVAADGRFTGSAATASPASRRRTGTKLVAVDTDVYDPLLGKTYAEIGSEARAMHKCQGFGQLLALPGPFSLKYPRRRHDSRRDGEERERHARRPRSDVPRLHSLPEHTPPPALVSRLGEIAERSRPPTNACARTGQRPRRSVGDGPAEGARAQRSTPDAGSHRRGRLRDRFPADATIEKFEDALASPTAFGSKRWPTTASSRRTADQADADRGQPWPRCHHARAIALEGLDGAAPTCQTGPLPSGAIVRCEVPVSIPANARTTEPYWTREGESGRYVFADDAPFGLPFRPTPFHARFELTLSRRTRSPMYRSRPTLRRQHLQRREAHGAARRARRSACA